MKKLAVLIFSLICLCGCVGKQGSTGPQGSQGVPGPTIGDTANYFETSGILGQSTFWSDSSFKYWYMNVPWQVHDDSVVVQVWVRQGTGYLWKEPEWYYSELSYVRIIDNSEVDPGYEYKVSVIYF